MTSEPRAISECPMLSVVVIGRNEGARLVRCLESIGQMTPLPGPVEVIYVDSGSTDGSLERAAQFKVKGQTPRFRQSLRRGRTKRRLARGEGAYNILPRWRHGTRTQLRR